MRRTVDYYFATMSPWAYLGHERFVRLASAAGAEVRVRPMDLGKIFPLSGGLPLGKRAPQRQAYRLVELRRWSEWLGLPLNLHPKHFPVSGDASCRLISVVAERDGTEAALRLAGAVLAAVWVQERDIADADTLAVLLHESGLDAARLAQSQAEEGRALADAHTQAAIDAGVFGAPAYVIDGEVYWGQDRLDFVERRLQA
ncbi:2-hydroxychromene-2-carboxylate isomerase [Hydrogenophaga sp. YM1]|uniref:2-hydroxychromene-2-carboxylate isomerase n=1 Tax=Hydrogenophaga TaxID=47420 RepID=UPI00086CFE53|nr:MULTISPECIES: 2-hydroxychromene-2-carboxylate isomerase [unclassified Hydrogenophaga]MBN9373673.1 2-hydroxychromene-2-carboxylate isomerase [Hydrogenophaga sp.]ODT34401.1 MAG: 2-hydroxychromene-2-carboxylate isomerase [Hydrogenophaga sp. SCN 70-13]OJV67028.1 MAG: 2-hydroxychromene-2-carboxylate isomerase [Hydrogenophaga sp. 70-12]QRR34626.1 2-hydroxychromene-2-carboxylate isomerase [Hydrogenophaga sp. YM1]